MQDYFEEKILFKPQFFEFMPPFACSYTISRSKSFPLFKAVYRVKFKFITNETSKDDTEKESLEIPFLIYKK